MQQEHLPPAPEGTVPEDEVLYALADLFRVFGDSSRIKILVCFARHRTLCAGYRRRSADEPVGGQPSAPGAEGSKLVRFRREGKTVYYALDDDHVRSILSMGMEHVEGMTGSPAAVIKNRKAGLLL